MPGRAAAPLRLRQFVGAGKDGFCFPHRLDELPVPGRRVVGNAGFFASGSEPRAVSDAELYDRLTGEFAAWLQAARGSGIVR